MTDQDKRLYRLTMLDPNESSHGADLSEAIDFINSDSPDTAFEPCVHISDQRNVTRQDEAHSSHLQKEILSLAPKAADDYVLVPKTV